MFFELGPIALESLPLGSRVVTPHFFEGLAGAVVAALGGADTGLALQQATIAPLAGTDLTPAFAADVAPAVRALDGLGLASDAADLGAAVSAIDAAAGDVDAQQRDVPGPDQSEPNTGLYGLIEPEPDVHAGPPGPPFEPSPGEPPTPPLTEEAVRAAIRGLYLELLGREPDAEGWDVWTRAILVDHHTLAWVRDRFLDSDEYHQKHGG